MLDDEDVAVELFPEDVPEPVAEEVPDTAEDAADDADEVTVDDTLDAAAEDADNGEIYKDKTINKQSKNAVIGFFIMTAILS